MSHLICANTHVTPRRTFVETFGSRISRSEVYCSFSLCLDKCVKEQSFEASLFHCDDDDGNNLRWGDTMLKIVGNIAELENSTGFKGV